MASSVFQVLNPQDAVITGHLTLNSSVSNPKNGIPVKLSSGQLVAATDHVSIGLLCELNQDNVLPWALYDRTDANDLTAWLGKKVGLLVKGIVRLPVSMVTGTLAEGAKVKSTNAPGYAVTSSGAGVGTIVNADVRDQHGSAAQYVDISFDFTAGAVPTS